MIAALPVHPGTALEYSQRLARVKQRETGPGVRVRTLFRQLGVRFRVNVKSLPGTPDLANKARNLAVFVHGCFWHGHPGCKKAKLPIKNRWWWTEKVRKN